MTETSGPPAQAQVHRKLQTGPAPLKAVAVTIVIIGSETGSWDKAVNTQGTLLSLGHFGLGSKVANHGLWP